MSDFTWPTEHRSFCLPDRIADLAAPPNRGPMSALGQKRTLKRASRFSNKHSSAGQDNPDFGELVELCIDLD
jgi:hypothetical protein